MKLLEQSSSTDERLERITEDLRKLPRERLDQLEKTIKSMGKKTLRLREAAEILGCSIDSLRRGMTAGTVKAFRINKGGDWRINFEEIERITRGDNSLCP